jgi:hypothetical protein
MALVGDQMRATTYGGNGIFVETNQYIFPLFPATYPHAPALSPTNGQHDFIGWLYFK